MRSNTVRAGWKVVEAALIVAAAACGARMDEEELADLEGAADVEGAGDEIEGLSDEDIGAVQSALTTGGVSIGNAGFESSWTGWTRVGATGLSGVAHSGAQSGKVSSTSGQVKRPVGGLKPSTKYVLSAYVKGYARIGVRNYGNTTVSKPIDAADWTKVSVTFTTGSSNTSAEIFASWVSGGDARVDD